MSDSPNLTCAETPLRDEEANYAELGCCTPTSKESRLPLAPVNCPPAPRKRRMATVGMSGTKRQRRLLLDDQAELIAVRAEDLEELFRFRDDATQPQTHSKRKKKKEKKKQRQQQRKESKYE